MRAASPGIRPGRKKRRRRPYSATVHYDQEGSGPTSAAARHKCRAGQRLQSRTGANSFIRQEGPMARSGAWASPRRCKSRSNSRPVDRQGFANKPREALRSERERIVRRGTDPPDQFLILLTSSVIRGRKQTPSAQMQAKRRALRSRRCQRSYSSRQSALRRDIVLEESPAALGPGNAASAS